VGGPPNIDSANSQGTLRRRRRDRFIERHAERPAGSERQPSSHRGVAVAFYCARLLLTMRDEAESYVVKGSAAASPWTACDGTAWPSAHSAHGDVGVQRGTVSFRCMSTSRCVGLLANARIDEAGIVEAGIVQNGPWRRDCSKDITDTHESWSAHRFKPSAW
jgi:hypothetical protein